MPHYSGDQEAAPQLVTNRERRNKSGPLAASVRVKFMELRPSMCRGPIGDPKHIETFRFCGSACSSGAIYCKAHTAKAHAPNRPRTPRTTNFLFQHPVKSRVTASVLSRAICTAEKPRSQPTTWIALEASRTDVAYYVRVRKLRLASSLAAVCGGRPSGGSKK